MEEKVGRVGEMRCLSEDTHLSWTFVIKPFIIVITKSKHYHRLHFEQRFVRCLEMEVGLALLGVDLDSPVSELQLRYHQRPLALGL